MQKLTKYFSISLILLSLIIITNCSEDEPTAAPGRDSKLVGTWELIEAFIPSLNLTLTAEQAGLEVTAVFSDDGSYQLTTVDTSGIMIESGTWTTLNGVLTTKDSADGSEEEMEYSVQGDIGVLKTTYEVQPGVELPTEFKFQKK